MRRFSEVAKRAVRYSGDLDLGVIRAVLAQA